MQEIPSQLDKRLQNIEATQQVIVELLLRADSPPDTEKKYLTTEQAAAYLNLSVSYLYQFTRNQQIKFYRFSRKLYFLKDDLDQFVNAKPKSQHP